MAHPHQIDSSIYAKAQENPEQSISVMMRVSKHFFSFHQNLPSNEPNNPRFSIFTQEINDYIASFGLPVIVNDYFANLCVFAIEGNARNILSIGEQDAIVGVELLAQEQK
jgi:hypothetical protein